MKQLITLLMSCLAGCPAAANVRDAAFASSADTAQARTGMFVGATYSVGFDRQANRVRSHAALKLTGMRYSPKTGQSQFGQGAELRIWANGTPALLVGGQEVAQVKRSANLSGGTVAIAVVGVLAIGAGVAYFALRDPCHHKECE